MKKLFLTLAAMAMVLSGCSEINDRLDGLESTVDAIQNTQIASITKQITSINSSLSKLEKTDTELKEYIVALQTRAGELEEEIKTTNNKITELKTSLEGQISAESARVIALLNAAKSDIQSELKSINALIVNLQNKDKELEGKIDNLKSYVDTELSGTEDWATATFATLEKFNELAAAVAAIGIDAQTVNTLLKELEERVDAKLAEAINGVKGELADAVADITKGYTDAIAAANKDIADAYTSAIKSAVDAAEASIKEWVNTQLAGYYTIAEADAKLEA